MFIYKITNKINNKIYIGQTIRSIEKRWKGHWMDIKRVNTYLSKAMKKYGKENFIIEEIDGANSLSELNYKEWIYIHKLNCLAPNGYNLKEGGRNGKMSKITREKMRSNKLGKKGPERSQEWRDNISKSKLGNKNGMFKKTSPTKGKSFYDWTKGEGLQKFRESRNKLKRKVVMLDDSFNEILCFYGLVDASKFVGLKSRSTITDCISRSKKTRKPYKAAGYFWKYYEQ